MKDDSQNPPHKRGRPRGSVSLTQEKWQTIVAYVRAGAFDYVAAEAAGVAERTFRSWIARGEGRDPDNPPTPKLRAFAEDVRRARAEARLGAEVRVYREQPRYWLSHAARSEEGRAGWTTPSSHDPVQKTREQKFADLVKRLHGGDDAQNERVNRTNRGGTS